MSEWQPIQTAPRHNRDRDGSTNQPRYLGVCDGEVREVRHYDCYWYDRHGEVFPTHWMPLPDPPKETT